MEHTSIISVRGLPKALIVSKRNAEIVSDLLADKNIPNDHVVRIEKHTFRKSDIKAVEINSDQSRGHQNETLEEFYREEAEKRMRYLKLTAQQKAQMLEVFIGLYKIALDELPSEETLGQARSIQERFFIENPKRTICDPAKLFTIIPRIPGKKINMYASAYVGLVEKAVLRDMRLAEK